MGALSSLRRTFESIDEEGVEAVAGAAASQPCGVDGACSSHPTNRANAPNRSSGGAEGAHGTAVPAVRGQHPRHGALSSSGGGGLVGFSRGCFGREHHSVLQDAPVEALRESRAKAAGKSQNHARVGVPAVYRRSDSSSFTPSWPSLSPLTQASWRSRATPTCTSFSSSGSSAFLDCVATFARDWRSSTASRATI